MRTGAQWRELPSYYGKPTTVHGWMCKFEKAGIFDKLWKALLEWADAWSEVTWQMQYVDGSLIKSPRGGSKTGKSRLHKWRLGSNRSVLVDGHGYPLAIHLAEANAHDTKLLDATLKACPIERPKNIVQHMFLDKGYFGKPSAEVLIRHGYQPHVDKKRVRGQAAVEVDPVIGYFLEACETSVKAGKRTGRWVVERSFAWMNSYRGLEIRRERNARWYEAQLKFAACMACMACMAWYRRLSSVLLQMPNAA